jgi:hypothetical protein
MFERIIARALELKSGESAPEATATPSQPERAKPRKKAAARKQTTTAATASVKRRAPSNAAKRKNGRPRAEARGTHTK